MRKVTRETGDSKPTQTQIGKRIGIHQTTIGRWLDDDAPHPTNAAQVAKFALAYDRNPLEAFVAAGMLTADEAGQGLTNDERRFLADCCVPPQRKPR